MTLDSTTTLWLWLGFIGMSLGTVIIASFWNRFKAEHRYHVILALIVTTIAAASYYAMASGQGVAVFAGKEIFFARYIDWILTTPVLLLSLILVGLPAVSDPEKRRQRNGLIAAILFADIAMIATGAIANFSQTVQDQTVWYLASVAWFLVIIWLLLNQVRGEAKASNTKTAKTYVSLLVFLLLLWVWYPVVWLLSNSGWAVIGTSTETAIYVVLDVTAKAVFGVVLLASIVKKKS
jgi:bacteriorhodopsin